MFLEHFLWEADDETCTIRGNALCHWHWEETGKRKLTPPHAPKLTCTLLWCACIVEEETAQTQGRGKSIHHHTTSALWYGSCFFVVLVLRYFFFHNAHPTSRQVHPVHVCCTHAWVQMALERALPQYTSSARTTSGHISNLNMRADACDAAIGIRSLQLLECMRSKTLTTRC